MEILLYPFTRLPKAAFGFRVTIIILFFFLIACANLNLTDVHVCEHKHT